MHPLPCCSRANNCRKPLPAPVYIRPVCCIVLLRCWHWKAEDRDPCGRKPATTATAFLPDIERIFSYAWVESLELKVGADHKNPGPGIDGIVNTAVDLRIKSLIFRDGQYVLAIGAYTQFHLAFKDVSCIIGKADIVHLQ